MVKVTNQNLKAKDTAKAKRIGVEAKDLHVHRWIVSGDVFGLGLVTDFP